MSSQDRIFALTLMDLTALTSKDLTATPVDFSAITGLFCHHRTFLPSLDFYSSCSLNVIPRTASVLEWMRLPASFRPCRCRLASDWPSARHVTSVSRWRDLIGPTPRALARSNLEHDLTTFADVCARPGRSAQPASIILNLIFKTVKSKLTVFFILPIS